MSSDRKIQHVLETIQEKTHLSQNLIALYTSRTLMRMSLGAVGIFLPIFFFTEYGRNIEIVIAIFLSLYGLHMLLTPLSARLLNVIGTRRMIMLGIGFLAVALIALYYFPAHPAYATIAYILFASFYRALFWVPYHVDFARSLSKTMRGRQLAILRNIGNTVLVAVPIVGGVIIATAGFGTLFLASVALMLVALLPMWFVPHTYERFSWNYVETFMHLFARPNRPLFIAHAANGAQGAATLVFWPIYAFLLLDDRFAVLGVIASLTLVALIVLRYFAGKLFDTWSHERVLTAGVVMSMTGWVSKLFVQTPFQVFAADSYHNLGKTVNSLSFDAVTYEQSADNGRYVDEYTALKEMALGIGRIVMLLLIAVLLAFFDIRVVFVVAALVALLMLLLNTKVRVR